MSTNTAGRWRNPLVVPPLPGAEAVVCFLPLYIFIIFSAVNVQQTFPRIAADEVIVSALLHLDHRPRNEDGNPADEKPLERVRCVMSGIQYINDSGAVSRFLGALARTTTVAVVVSPHFGLTVRYPRTRQMSGVCVQYPARQGSHCTSRWHTKGTSR